jgi:hypothetical protein
MPSPPQYKELPDVSDGPIHAPQTCSPSVHTQAFTDADTTGSLERRTWNAKHPTAGCRNCGAADTTRKDKHMLWLIGAVTLALVGMGAAWGTVGTAVILFTAVAWMLLVFRPVEAGALVANLARRRFE